MSTEGEREEGVTTGPGKAVRDLVEGERHSIVKRRQQTEGPGKAKQVLKEGDVTLWTWETNADNK